MVTAVHLGVDAWVWMCGDGITCVTEIVLLHVQEADDAPTGNDAEDQAPLHPPDATPETAPTAEAAVTLPDEMENMAEVNPTDGDETEAEDVDEALEALDQLMVLNSACVHVNCNSLPAIIVSMTPLVV